MAVLSCIALSAACDGGVPQSDISGRTEVNLLISDPTTPDAELLVLIDFVSYRITCPDSGLTPYNDSADLAGNFEVDALRMPPVWELVTNLPLADPDNPPSYCTISMWVFYEDEVVCSGYQTLDIYEDGSPLTPNKADVVLECNLSVIPPSGDAEIDGSFDFVHGNYCPQLIWLGAVPTVVDPAVPAVTSIETYSFDPDGTCGQNCDPQTCDFTMNPPVCTPALDPGFSSMLRAPAGNGSFGNPDAVGNPSLSNTTYTCNPLFPGPTEICVLATDGDNDCDRIRCTTIICPDLCEGVVCDDGNECTRDLCNPLDGSCSNDDAPNGIACSSCAGTCQAGVCDLGLPFTAAQTGTVMTFTGALQPLNTTLVNPYSGRSATITGGYNLNTSSYLGVGPSAVLIGTNLGDALFVQDPVGTQRICGVNEIIAGVGFDVMFLADAFVVLKGMIVTGGDTSDILWGNVGDDMISGNRGMDLIDGGPGNDIINGGNGDDTITLWPGGGSDSISGGIDIDTLEIDAIQSQILIEPAADTLYEYDIWYLGTLMAEIREVEFIVMNDRSIDLATCTGGPGDVCNLCGNDALNGTEGCDDGNNVDGDGCAADCTAEY